MSKFEAGIINLRTEFTWALSDWNVAVTISEEYEDNEVTVSFVLWGHEISGRLVFYRGEWITPDDSPHRVGDCVSVWRWISMRMADALDAKPTIYEKDVRPLLISIRQKLAPTERAAIDSAVLDLVELYPALASDA